MVRSVSVDKSPYYLLAYLIPLQRFSALFHRNFDRRPHCDANVACERGRRCTLPSLFKFGVTDEYSLDHYESTNNVRGGDTSHLVLPLDPKPSRGLSPAIDYHDNTRD
jgi:hypothetical protein